jgi:uncharacterized protein
VVDVTTRTFTEQETALLRRIRETVHAIEPTAQIILYGSRARGDAAPDSDWDLLVLLDGHVPYSRIDAVRHRLYELEWDTDTVLSSIVRSKTEWDSPLYDAMPFHANVQREGMRL